MPGTLFEIVAGAQTNGILNSGYLSRADVSWITDLYDSKPPIINKPWILCFLNCCAILSKPTSFASILWQPNKEPPTLVQPYTFCHLSSLNLNILNKIRNISV